METLENNIWESSMAKDLKEKYADILDKNFTLDMNNPRAVSDFKNKINRMTQISHPDKCPHPGDESKAVKPNDILNIVADLRQATKKGTPQEIKTLLSKLDNTLNSKINALTRNKAELNNLKAQFGDSFRQNN